MLEGLADFRAIIPHEPEAGKDRPLSARADRSFKLGDFRILQ